MPMVLVFHVSNMNKNRQKLKFGEIYKDNYGMDGDEKSVEYRLQGVVEHLGKSRKEGHYISLVTS